MRTRDSQRTCESSKDEWHVREETGKKGERWMPRLSGGEEGRGKLRKGAGIRKQELIRACPNGATRQVEGLALP